MQPACLREHQCLPGFNAANPGHMPVQRAFERSCIWVADRMPFGDVRGCYSKADAMFLHLVLKLQNKKSAE